MFPDNSPSGAAYVVTNDKGDKVAFLFPDLCSPSFFNRFAGFHSSPCSRVPCMGQSSRFVVRGDVVWLSDVPQSITRLSVLILMEFQNLRSCSRSACSSETHCNPWLTQLAQVLARVLGRAETTHLSEIRFRVHWWLLELGGWWGQIEIWCLISLKILGFSPTFRFYA